MRGFSIKLLQWYKLNQRDLPWRRSKDPYTIWISEIILQQTRVNQGLSYYQNFIKTFPTIRDLAKSSSDEVMKAWQGLGYYSRARNLHETAKHIVKNLDAAFPTTFNEIIKLKGIGIYTASAISSIAFNERKAVVDGNVYRVISRLFGIADPIDSTKGKTIFQEFANKLISSKNPGDYNQAIMEFGATVCKPKNPSCDSCIFLEDCFAFRNGKINELPVKHKKTKVKTRFINYVLFRHGEKIMIRKRVENDIWQSLYEFYSFAEGEQIDLVKTKEFPFKNILPSSTIQSFSRFETFKHQLSHQNIFCTIGIVKLKQPFAEKGYRWVNINTLHKYAFPRVLDRFLTREGFLLPKKKVNLRNKIQH